MGLDKLKNLESSTQFFASLGSSHPLFHTYLVGYIELICGLLLIAGLASRLAALPLVFTTLAVLATAHTPAIAEWKFITHPSLIAHAPPYPLLISALLVLIFGPGRVSLDAWIKRWVHKRNA
jgi:putative oxidoreductase